MKLPQAPLRTGYITFAGGLDTETPAIATSPGSVQDSINVYQGARGGYVVTKGYERFDGRPAPHLAVYSTLTVDDGAAFTVGQIVTTATASGVIVAIADDSLHLTKVSGTFASGDTLLVGGVATGAVGISGKRPVILSQSACLAKASDNISGCRAGRHTTDKKRISRGKRAGSFGQV